MDLKALLRRVAKEGLNHVLVEGGSEMYGSLLKARLADTLALFLAPKLLGAEGLSWVGGLGISAMTRALQVKDLRVEHHGQDLLLLADLSGAGREGKRLLPP